MKTVNKRVACTPFETTDAKVVVTKGLAQFDQKQRLTKLTVVYDAESDDHGSYHAGDSVYVTGDCCKHTFAKQVYEVEEGKPFIFVPYDMIVAKEKKPYEKPAPTRIPGPSTGEASE